MYEVHCRDLLEVEGSRSKKANFADEALMMSVLVLAYADGYIP